MKKFIFTLSFILSATCLTFAQWTTSGSNVVLTNTANRVGIGYNSNTDSKLYIFSQSDQHGLKIQNDYLSSATKYGIYNRMNTGGTGTKYGIYNKTDGNSAVTSPVYGIYSTTTVNGSPSNLYGMYSIVNTAGTGNHYAIYGTTNGSSAGNDWAGYFQGRGYFQGNVGIGTNFPTNDLSVTGTANITNTLFIGGTSSSGFPLAILGSASTGILNTNNYSGTSGKFGFRNEVSSDGTGQRWGIQNNVTGNSSSNQDIYGIKNTANSASGSSSDVYGTYNQVSTQGTGNHYAVYGDMNNSAASNDWAGYFEGRGYFSGFLGIGTNTPTEKLDVDGKLRIRDLALDNSKDSILVACGDGTVAYRNFSSMIDSDWTVSGSDIYSSVSGNVGIGTSFPSAKLDVVGDAEINGIEIGKGPGNYFDNTIVGDDALNSNTSGQANSAFGFQCQTSNTTGNFNSAFGYQSLEDNSSGTYNVAMGAFAIKNNTNTWGNVAIGYRALENSSNGYNTSVGYESGRNAGSYGVYIGNRAGYHETGNNKLYISNDSTSSPLIYGDFATDELRINGKLSIRDLALDNSKDSVLVACGNGKVYYRDAASFGGGASQWAISDTNIYNLNTGGVVIGASTPAAGYKLSVDGRIIAEEMQVLPSGSWPDYVFNKDYSLMSLQEVEKFVQTNKHLPGVPSAKTVKEEGVSLGEMNRVMLEKIEELTLHVIEQSKQNKEQSEILQAQSEQIKKLQQENIELKKTIKQ